MRTYDQTVILVSVEITEAIERVRTALGTDLAKFGTVDADRIAKGIVDDLSWSYGKNGRR